MKRQLFILCLFCTTLICEESSLYGYPDSRQVVFEGSVRCAGIGIENVAVTDGISIVKTDSCGNYRLYSDTSSCFVYYTLPSGYESPGKGSVPQFFINTSTIDSRSNVDFELIKSTVPQDMHRFIAWADPQIFELGELDMLKEIISNITDTMEDWNDSLPVHGLSLGDNVFDKMHLLSDYMAAINALNFPFYQVVGNHDMDHLPSGGVSSASFSESFGPTYYSFNRGNIHYVVLNDVFFYGYKRYYMGRLDDVQLKWLRQDLASVSNGSTVVVSLHIPTKYGDTKDETKAPIDKLLNACVVNSRELYKILEPYNVHILAGHSHIQWNTQLAPNILEHVHAAASGAWWEGLVAKDGTPKGYTVYQVDGDKLKWFYKGVGLPHQKQFRAYLPGVDTANLDMIVVNVFNYDLKWRVEWYENGVRRGEMEKFWGSDPLAKELYPPGCSTKHKWLQYGVTGHLFRAKPSDPSAHIEIEVTDRFGNRYRETLK